SLIPRRDMYTVKGSIDDIMTHDISDDYVFVTLTDETTVLSPMEKLRSVYPNAMHISRENLLIKHNGNQQKKRVEGRKMSDLDLFKAFYEEVTGEKPTEESEVIFTELLDELLIKERDL